MGMATDRGSAVIYEFPKRGRFATNSDRTDYMESAPLQYAPKISLGSGWYHDEAIEAERRSH